ncbi:MAG: outer-membrane lipoprotein carrier protein LolA [Bacteroidaceae bacterium]|nr:outer-membrane lipoprotein carrier protein LolA [Bacteroidaceae bacterium]
MRKIFLTIVISLITSISVFAQDAKATMDKAAAAFKKSSISATYKATGQMNDEGTIAIKGQKFCAKGRQATVWFNGKTQWTYMKSTNEVNISAPNNKKISVVNPYAFINLYKSGYDLTQKKTAKGTEVHMKATTSKSFKEVYITLNSSLQPVQIKFLGSKGAWTTIAISNYKTASLPESTFRFNKKDYPDAEVIDLR